MRKNGVKILRALMWGVGLILGSIGAVLLIAGSSSEAVAEGTTGALTGWGAGVLVVALILLSWNFVWGMKRWADKWYE